MRACDIIVEKSDVKQDVRDLYTNKGYKLLGTGGDQIAFLAPDGTVLKIFGTSTGSGPKNFSKSQQSFIDFATYSANNKNNRYLPNFLGWRKFNYPRGSNNWYLEIKMERLFPFSDQNLAIALSDLADAIERYKEGGPKYFLHFVDHGSAKEVTAKQQLLIHLGKKGFSDLSKALIDLAKIAKAKHYIFDLTEKNFMLSSEGDFVISDPFYYPGFW